jgi:hypothetical protein
VKQRFDVPVDAAFGLCRARRHLLER